MRRIVASGSRVVPLALATLGCTASPPRDPAAERVDRVVSTLAPVVRVIGRPPARFDLPARMAHYRTPGVSIAVVDSGRIAWARGFGLTASGGDSVTPLTLFQAASISKPVAATAMLRLVDEGRLSLDTDVNAFLRSWRLPADRFTRAEKVTLRRLASHSAGLTVDGFPGYAPGAERPTVPQILDGAKPANTGPVRPDTLPGAMWRYSGGGTTVMQLVLTDLTGEDFPALARRLVLEPAGMSRSTYEQPLPAPRAGEAAAGHKLDGQMVPGRWHVYPEMAAAGLWTTPTDLLRWAIAIADAWSGRPGAILSRELAREMLTVQKGPTGLGPFLEGSGRALNFGHGGANEGYRAQLIFFPETGQGAAVMTNGDNGGTLAEEVLFAIAAEYGWPEHAPREVEPLPLDSATRASVAGRYELKTPVQAAILVTADSSGLHLEVPGFVPREELVFTAELTAVGLTTGNTYAFERGSDGRPGALVVGGLRAVRTP